jgi:HEAT repeat protein
MGFLNKIFGGASEPSARVSELMEQLGSSSAEQRKVACDALAELGDDAKPASELLEELLSDEDGDVCNAAAAAISKVVRDY